MKILSLLFLAFVLVTCTTPKEKVSDNHETHKAVDATQSKSKSPKQMAITNVGDNHVHIEYHSPSKRGRQIFGGLVAYGEVWVTGAHSATSISFVEDLVVGGQMIPAGKYALFTIPGESTWTVIINKNWDQHLADKYDQSEDLVRFDVTPVPLDEPVESLTYEVLSKENGVGVITISWDQVMIAFEIENKQ